LASSSSALERFFGSELVGDTCKLYFNLICCLHFCQFLLFDAYAGRPSAWNARLSATFQVSFACDDDDQVEMVNAPSVDARPFDCYPQRLNECACVCPAILSCGGEYLDCLSCACAKIDKKCIERPVKL
jgi:hypothetical protein